MAWFIKNPLSGAGSVLTNVYPEFERAPSIDLALYDATTFGRDVDTTLLPDRLYLRNPRKKVSEIFGCYFGYAVSPQVKDLIETWDPSPKHFYPFELFKSKRGASLGTYYYLHLLEPLDPVQFRV